MVLYIQANYPNSVNKMMIFRPCIWQGRYKSKHIEHSSPRTIPHLFLEQHEQIAYTINHKSPSEATCVKNIGIVNSHELAITLRNIQLLVLSFQTSSSSKLQIPFAKPAAYEMLMFMLLRQDRNNARIIQKKLNSAKGGAGPTSSLKYVLTVMRQNFSTQVRKSPPICWQYNNFSC